ncbi:MAG: hypothetical protein Hens3KO_16810 [Henriciella sp.]
MKRREFLSATSGLAVTALVGSKLGTAQAALPKPDISLEAEALELMSGEADTGWDPAKYQEIMTPRSVTGNGWQWWDHPVDIRPEIGWASDEDSSEYSHLGTDAVGPDHTFALSHDGLTWLAERNHFQLEADAKKVVFGLRGCTLASGDPDSGWVRTAALKTTRPNHEDMNCLIGVWDRTRLRLRVFQGSTVPQAAYLYKQMKRQSGANMLPCGLYAYEVGTHALSSRKHRQIGALRLIGYWNPEEKEASGPVVVLRSLNDLVFTPRDAFEVWDTCNPNDNIHSTTWSVTGRWQDGPMSPDKAQYSSAGCQVVRGTYEMDASRKFKPLPTDQWKAFREALGMTTLSATSTDPLPEYGDHYHYMLLTGDEAALAETEAKRAASTYECVRFGSSGDAVKLVQGELDLEADGLFGPSSVRKLIEAQIAAGVPVQIPLRRLDVRLEAEGEPSESETVTPTQPSVAAPEASAPIEGEASIAPDATGPVEADIVTDTAPDVVVDPVPAEPGAAVEPVPAEPEAVPEIEISIPEGG